MWALFLCFAHLILLQEVQPTEHSGPRSACAAQCRTVAATVHAWSSMLQLHLAMHDELKVAEAVNSSATQLLPQCHMLTGRQPVTEQLIS